ncbi:UDP-N-acetylmuramate:L-alanyl-gamma-D-glutamyl-meso-diaminopimelate ligase [candidate division KSB1 bacterium]|nr:UDP-N-acetylmuramate:L-alanyl-gamma-D-glutamyl-meso-diaminopimelate ligase [candidate division KSB1 bacterium]
MAPLAVMLKQKGHTVWGVDEDVYPPMSLFLAENDIPVHIGYDPAHLDPAPDLVVVGNTISRGNPEIEEILNRRIPIVSLPEAIRDYLIRGHRSIVVTGTHGKTTTSALLAWIFQQAGRRPNFLVGGLLANFGRGFQLSDGPDVILEGDEYDSAYFDKVAKFLHYQPDIGVINHVEFDHADIYNSFEEIQTAFKRFVNLIPGNGFLVACSDFSSVREVIAKSFCEVETFGLQDSPADWRADAIHFESNRTVFDVIFRGQVQEKIEMPLPGAYNVRNALAAIAVARHVQIEWSDIRQGFSTFAGVMRRMEFKGSAGGVDIYDDFGHHPTAIREALIGFKRHHPESKVWALFEPRSATTRRSIFQSDLAEALSEADRVLIAPVHRPDKAPPGQVLSCERLVNDLIAHHVPARCCPASDRMVEILLDELRTGDAVITFSNGPFGGIHQKLLDALSYRDHRPVAEQV